MSRLLVCWYADDSVLFKCSSASRCIRILLYQISFAVIQWDIEIVRLRHDGHKMYSVLTREIDPRVNKGKSKILTRVFSVLGGACLSFTRYSMEEGVTSTNNRSILKLCGTFALPEFSIFQRASRDSSGPVLICLCALF